MPAFKPLPPDALLSSLTPRQIVAELDKYVVGQHRAKRAVAIALRNRLRRRQLPPDMADDVAPKNILMIGPTGVGKTEIARRLARLAQSPFLKVEASRFTEVGYVGRDVESMVRDLVEIAVGMVRDERVREVRQAAEARAEERLLDLLLPPGPHAPAADGTAPEAPSQTRERLRAQLRAGKLDERTVEIDVRETSMPLMQVVGGTSMEEIGLNLRDMLPGMFQGRRRSSTHDACPTRARTSSRRSSRSWSTWRASRARPSSASSRAASSSWTRSTRSPDARAATAPTSAARACSATSCRLSRARPSTPSTAWCGPTTSCSSRPGRSTSRSRRTSSPSCRAGSRSASSSTRSAATSSSASCASRGTRWSRSTPRCMATEGVDLQFTDDAIERVAELAALVNERMENIGARRLHTVMEKLLDEISFEGPDLAGKSITIDAAYVDRMLADIVKNEDLSRYIL